MLIHVLFFYLFRNAPSPGVDASPILNLTINSMSSIPSSFIPLAPRQADSSMDGTCNCNQRTMRDIVWSCIATLFLCTWSSIHPNMPAPKDEWWRILWRRLKSMYWALVAPELVLTWAVRQWMGARDILKKYNKISDELKWTKKHAHFLQMGGFHLRELEGNKTSLLQPETFFELLKEKKISVQSIEEKDIEDKSKADALTKIVVTFQTLWFVIQCIGRHAQGLALAQLEIATVAVISCTFILCVIWWDKPFDAQQPIYLDRLTQTEYPLADTISRINISQQNVLACGITTHSSLDHSLINQSEQAVASQPVASETCIGRQAQGLVLTPLDVATLAVISCTFILCFIWCDEPFDAQQPINSDRLSHHESLPEDIHILPDTTSQELVIVGGTNEPISAEQLATSPSDASDIPKHTNNNPRHTNDFPQRDIHSGDTNIGASITTDLLPMVSLPVDTPRYDHELGQTYDVENPCKKQTFIRLLFASISTTVSPIYHAICKEVIEADTTVIGRVIEISLGWTMINPIMNLVAEDVSRQARVGSYYSYSGLSGKFIFLPVLSAALFGLVHCLSWESEFPSAKERVLWRISAIGVGSLLAVFGLLLEIIQRETSLDLLIGIVTTVLFLAYILTRYYLLIEALLSLRALPPSAFRAIEWSDFLPHM